MSYEPEPPDFAEPEFPYEDTYNVDAFCDEIIYDWNFVEFHVDAMVKKVFDPVTAKKMLKMSAFDKINLLRADGAISQSEFQLFHTCRDDRNSLFHSSDFPKLFSLSDRDKGRMMDTAFNARETSLKAVNRVYSSP